MKTGSNMKGISTLLACVAALSAMPAAAAVDVDAYIKKDSFEDIKLSPTGEYYAATVPMEDRTVMVVIRRADNKLTANVTGGENSVIADFEWVSPDRIVVGLAQKFGALDQPQLTGELFSINAATGSDEMLIGQRMSGASLGTKLPAKKAELVAAFLVDELPADDKNVVISVMPFSGDPFTRAEIMDVKTGTRRRVANAPVRNADFLTDNAGLVRFARGYGADNVQQLYYRKGDGAQWQIVSTSGNGRKESAIGFSSDNQTAYLKVEQPEGPDAIVALDLATMLRKEVLRDDDTDPYRIIYRNGTNIPVGAFFMDPKPRTAFFDNKSKEATLYRSLEAAFGGPVRITSQTRDGRLALVLTWSDRNPGDFYVFDTEAKKASHLLSRSDWFDPEKMASMTPFQFKARDDLQLHGYLTTPKGSDGKNLPMIVMPHGGPFEIQDTWGFDQETQMLAEAGYAVLQLNFRGSGGYGAAFTHAGARQWGRTMQDDLTDATRWAIEQGIADSKRICIYGASYGGYASLMGVAKESSLYKCAVGYVGVYDLPTMHTEGDIQRRGSGEAFIREWIGDREALSETSPNRIAERIKVPVLLAAGGEDERAPIKHSEMMEKALRNAGVPVETLYYPTEGHGFYLEEHRREYYTRLLAFLGRHLGGSVADAKSGAPPATGK
jgi:dipeptidyl aminopeptidase/acylaminoacyl peptidase